MGCKPEKSNPQKPATPAQPPKTPPQPAPGAKPNPQKTTPPKK